MESHRLSTTSIVIITVVLSAVIGLGGLTMYVTEKKPAEFFKPTSTAVFILSAASLALGFGARNASISDRLRTVSKALCDAKKDNDKEREESTERQVHMFMKRYTFSQCALSLELIALPSFLAMLILSGEGYLARATDFFCIGVIVVGAGCVITIIEVVYGQVTLADESRFAIEYSKPIEDSESLIRSRLDVLLYCNRQYDDIAHRFRHDIERRIKSDKGEASRRLAESYWARFWNHQVEQFRFFMGNLVKPDDLVFWLEERRAELKENLLVGEVSIQDGWTSYNQRYPNNEFDNIVRLITGDKSALEALVQRRLVERDAQGELRFVPPARNSATPISP